MLHRHIWSVVFCVKLTEGVSLQMLMCQDLGLHPRNFTRLPHFNMLFRLSLGDVLYMEQYVYLRFIYSSLLSSKISVDAHMMTACGSAVSRFLRFASSWEISFQWGSCQCPQWDFGYSDIYFVKVRKNSIWGYLLLFDISKVCSEFWNT